MTVVQFSDLPLTPAVCLSTIWSAMQQGINTFPSFRLHLPLRNIWHTGKLMTNLTPLNLASSSIFGEISLKSTEQQIFLCYLSYVGKSRFSHWAQHLQLIVSVMQAYSSLPKAVLVDYLLQKTRPTIIYLWWISCRTATKHKSCCVWVTETETVTNTFYLLFFNSIISFVLLMVIQCCITV